MAGPSASLLDPLTSATQHTLLNSLWNVNVAQVWDDAGSNLTAYWHFYEATCAHALHDGGRHNLARTHRDVVELVQDIKNGATRAALRENLRCKFSQPCADEGEVMDATIDLAANLLLMIDFGGVRHGFSDSRRLDWSQDSLQDCITRYFEAGYQLGHAGVKLPRIFNAPNLSRMAGVQLVPTSNLLDHLRLADDDTKLYIFHHVGFLRLQRQSSILPPMLVEETLSSLALLFPDSDPESRRWCRGSLVFPSFDSQILSCGHLKTDDRQIERFSYWHDRLVILKQVFDETTPRNLSQWWYDRRNGVQWWTFWVAILVLGMTLLFGFVQCVTGIMQVYAAFHPKTEE